MQLIQPKVRKLDVRFLDMIRSGLKAGITRLGIRQRWIKIHFWRGKIEYSETVTIGEVDHASRQ